MVGWTIIAGGKLILARIDTICLHGDGPEALGIAKATRAALEEADIKVGCLMDGPSCDLIQQVGLAMSPDPEADRGICDADLGGFSVRLKNSTQHSRISRAACKAEDQLQRKLMERDAG